MVKILELLCLVSVIAGCMLTAENATLPPIGATVEAIGTGEAIIAPLPTSEPDYPWQDASQIVSGICFEAANDMAVMNRRFLISNSLEHIAFYDALDSTALCLRPLERVPFDFSTGRALAGLWSAGRGCTAQHQVLSYSETDEALTISLAFVTSGDCNYELVRPFWISFDARRTLNWMVEGG